MQGEVSFQEASVIQVIPAILWWLLREAQEETALNPFDVKLLGDLPIQRAQVGLSGETDCRIDSCQVELIAQPQK